MTTTVATKKITMATLKSFVKKNAENLFVNVKSEFDGMTDGTEQRHEGFKKAVKNPKHENHDLGYEGIWCVGSSRDYLRAYDDAEFTGIEVSNSCGRFIVAVKK